MVGRILSLFNGGGGKCPITYGALAKAGINRDHLVCDEEMDDNVTVTDLKWLKRKRQKQKQKHKTLIEKNGISGLWAKTSMTSKDI